MNRRELVKAAGSILVSHKLAEFAFDFRSSGGGYIVFYDPKLLRGDFVGRSQKIFPPDTVFCAVDVPPGKSIDEAIKIYH